MRDKKYLPRSKKQRSQPAKSTDGTRRYNFQEQVGFLLRKAYQSHSLLFQRMCPDPQLTTAQFAVMCALRDGGACSLTDIGRAVVMDPATTRGIVGRLKERNLVSLGDDPVDRRRMVVDLNDRGRALLASVIPHAKAITEATLEPLNTVERVALLHLLSKLAPNGEINAAISSEDA
jgi:MarR family transcriptional regulator, lower aerobic nicotinate degradation pathway regulator